VYRQFIGKRDHSQETSAKLVHSAPKTITIVLLQLCTNGRANDSNAHVLGKVRSLAHNLIFKIWRELIVRHASSMKRAKSEGRIKGRRRGHVRHGQSVRWRTRRMEPQGCTRHRWVKPRGRNERERVSQSVRWRRCRRDTDVLDIR
jgi:hypothetical protein